MEQAQAKYRVPGWPSRFLPQCSSACAYHEISPRPGAGVCAEVPGEDLLGFALSEPDQLRRSVRLREACRLSRAEPACRRPQHQARTDYDVSNGVERLPVAGCSGPLPDAAPKYTGLPSA